MARKIDVPDEIADIVEQMVKDWKAGVPSVESGRPVDTMKAEESWEAAGSGLERALGRRWLQSLDVDEPTILVNGKLHAKVGRYEAPYFTKAGPVTVERSLYREVGKRNAPTVDPVSLRAGVVEDGWLPSAAKAIAFLLQQVPSREAEATAKQLGRLPFSRSSFERIGHAVGAMHGIERSRVEDALIAGYEVPAGAASISVSLDRGAVPMEEPRPRPAGRPREGAPKRPVARNWRMAYAGTVTLHDARGESLHTIRYARMPKSGAKELVASMAADVKVLLGRQPKLKVVLLTDGAQEMVDLLDAALNRESLGVEVHRLVDFWHVIEKLGRAAVVVFGAAASADAVRRWKALLLNSATARGRILEELYRSGHENVRVGKERPVHDGITYLNNQGDRMDYAAARRRGLPVGSGNVEATCKSLFGLRMKRTGARWKEDTGQHVLDLRALAISDRWEPAIKLTLAPLRAEVRRAA